MSASIIPTITNKSSSIGQQQTTSSNSPQSTSTVYDDFPRHVESYSDERPPDLLCSDRSIRPDTPTNTLADPVHSRFNLGSGSNPGLMMRGTTSRHSHPAVNSNHSRPYQRPRPSEPVQKSNVNKEPRKCWICYDDEEFDELLPINGFNDTTSQLRARRRWVKPCRCSLVAHESCLLTWITTYQLTHAPPNSVTSPLSTPVNCPQCSATYNLAQPSSHLLTLIHRFKRPYDKVLSWSALGCVLLGIGITTSSYGLWASRCFLGPTRWNRWIMNFNGRFDFIKLFQLSLVGPILILSRTNQLDSVLPFLPVSLILSNLPPTTNSLDQESISNNLQFINLDSVFPPDPALTLCLIPWARIGWNWLWSKVTYIVLAHEYKSLEFMGVAHGVPSGLGLEGGPQPALGPNAIGRQDDVGDQRPNLLGAANEAGRGPLGAEVVLDYTTLRGAIRIGMEALILPGAASMAGNILLMLSKNRTWLRTFLGIRTILNYSQFKKPSNGSIWSRFTSSLGTTFNRVIGLRVFGNQFDGSSGGPSDWKVESLVSYRNEVAEDPVWWRNTLGGVLIVLVKDVMGLVEKVLKIRKLSQRRILDVV
ncbi:hypothetical protein CROQUDRAFT_53796 [Cronartium quercuum f. sp. fusiforme G11]|uniref:RING-CH-type domain-containing protein n=1 Tax=Cronartium quercuum f. sp. fusiforme G11 TaxID=708437 RepID=A0A9P6N601_9BASI|nr:hypothetical protein CROQUDRAFT_53796 [Cronartium quercuum f. sp. fusiforme G11]